MGCLNSKGQFNHWFANIHLSGPCNRACYFCIGQHMMALDTFNTLDTYPLPGWDEFVTECKKHHVRAVYLTGSNTDPLLYRHIERLADAVRDDINVSFGVRTNGVTHINLLERFQRGSVSIPSFNPAIYRKMMGHGDVPNLKEILKKTLLWEDVPKVNVVLGPENTSTGDIFETLDVLYMHGIMRVNLREPYGQPHVGNPLEKYTPYTIDLGMPKYRWGLYGPLMEVCYWDVHYVEVESVNLYASGRVSTTYPISKGHADTGEVHDQTYFPGGRVQQQWLNYRGK